MVPPVANIVLSVSLNQPHIFVLATLVVCTSPDSLPVPLILLQLRAKLHVPLLARVLPIPGSQVVGPLPLAMQAVCNIDRSRAWTVVAIRLLPPIAILQLRRPSRLALAGRVLAPWTEAGVPGVAVPSPAAAAPKPALAPIPLHPVVGPIAPAPLPRAVTPRRVAPSVPVAVTNTGLSAPRPPVPTCVQLVLLVRFPVAVPTLARGNGHV